MCLRALALPVPVPGRSLHLSVLCLRTRCKVFSASSQAAAGDNSRGQIDITVAATARRVHRIRMLIYGPRVCDRPCHVKPRQHPENALGVHAGRQHAHTHTRASTRELQTGHRPLGQEPFGAGQYGFMQAKARGVRGSGTSEDRDGLNRPLNGCSELVPIGFRRRFSKLAGSRSLFG